MKRLLLVTARPLDQPGGSTARWRSFARHLPKLGWQVDVIAARVPPGAAEFSADPRALRHSLRRSRLMSRVGRVSSPLFSLVGVNPEALPPSMAWIPRGALQTRRRLRQGHYDALIATGPPFAALIAARLASSSVSAPLVVELRDLWASNPAYDRGGKLLNSLEAWVFKRASAVVACTPEAVENIRSRHVALASRILEIPNGFEPELLGKRATVSRSAGRLAIMHSGALTPARPLEPLLQVLSREPYRSSFCLVLHGFLAPEIRREVDAARGSAEVVILPPSGWCAAVQQMAEADVTLISQTRGAGDETAVAAKVYEYLALGKPVLCLSHGGATEALLTRLNADKFCARLDDESSIEMALDHLRAEPLPEPLPASRLAPYDRRQLATRLVELLESMEGSAKLRPIPSDP